MRKPEVDGAEDSGGESQLVKAAATQLSDEVFVKWFKERVEPTGKTVSGYLHAFIVGEIEGVSRIVENPGIPESSTLLACPFRCGQGFPNTQDGCSDMRVHVFNCPAGYKHTPLYKGPTHS